MEKQKFGYVLETFWMIDTKIIPLSDTQNSVFLKWESKGT